MVLVACQPKVLDMSTQAVQIDVTLAQTCLPSDEDLGSIGEMDFFPSYSTAGLGTMTSPSTGSSGVHCNSFDAVVREQITVAPQVNDNCSSDCQTPGVFDAFDPYINDLCSAEIPTDETSFFGNNVSYSIFSDHEFPGTNLIYELTEGFVPFPSPEKSTMDVTDSNYEACEESERMFDNTWFPYMCHQTKSSQEYEVSHCQIDSNEVDYSDPESFIKAFLDLSDESNSLPALVSKETSKKKHTLVLDLDETLVHSSWELCDGVDFTVQFTDNDTQTAVYVRKRPFLEVFLRRVSEIFEVIIFTASQKRYADKLLDVLDPDRKFFSGRRYRDSCILLDDVYTKDLTVLGIDLAKVFIVDNSPQVFRLQPDNGIPIKSWFNDDSDSSLMSLLLFLETLVDVDDVRPIIANKFRAC